MLNGSNLPEFEEREEDDRWEEHVAKEQGYANLKDYTRYHFRPVPQEGEIVPYEAIEEDRKLDLQIKTVLALDEGF